MAEPARKLDDDDRKLSALERAHNQWGLPDSGPGDSEGESEAVQEEKSGLDKAKDRWGEADVVDGDKGKDKGENPDDDKSGNEFNYHNEGGKSKQQKRRIRGWGGMSSGKKWAVGGGAVAGIVVSIGLAITAFIPNLVGQQLRDYLLNKAGELQSYQSRKYRRTHFNKMSDMFSRDGRRGGKVIAEMERRGYKFSFDRNGPNPNRITEIHRPGTGTRPGTGISGADMADEMETFMDNRYLMSLSGRWKSNRMKAFYKRYGISTASPTRVHASADLDDPDRTMRKRAAGAILTDDYDPEITGRRNPADASTDAEADRIRAENAELEEIADNDGAFGAAKRQALDGDNLSEVGDDAAKAAAEIDAGFGERVFSIAKSGKRSIGGIIRSFSLLGTGDQICTLRNRLRFAITAGRTYRAIALTKTAALFITAAGSARTGWSNSKLVNSLFKRVTKPDSNGASFGSSTVLQRIVRGTFSKSRNADAKTGFGVDGKLTGVYGGIHNTVEKTVGCSVYQNPVAQVGEGILSVGISIFSFGLGGAAKTGAQQAAKVTISNLVRAAISRAVLKSVAKSVIIGLVANLTIDHFMNMAQMYAEKTMTMPSTSQELGKDLADKAFAGAEVLQTQRALEAGQVPATEDNYVLAYQDFMDHKAEERKHQSVFARVFDIHNLDSMASQVMWSMPMTMGQYFSSIGNMFSSIPSLVAGLPSTTLAMAGTPFGMTAHAQDADQVAWDTYTVDSGNDNDGTRLATGASGALLTYVPDQILAIDPVENIQYLKDEGHIDPNTEEPISSQFTGHLENCVYTTDLYSTIEHGDPNTPQDDCLARLEITRRFKAYLAWKDMQDSFDAAALPEEIVSENGSTATNGQIDCSSAVGNQKIVCAAKNYLGIKYSNNGSPALNGGADAASWLSSNPSKASQAGVGIDCSGFTNLALYTAFNYKTTAGCSGAYVSGGDSNIVEVSLDDLRPGDFLTVSRVCNSPGASGHIGIYVGRNPDGSIITLESAGGRNRDGQRESGYYEKEASSLGGYWKYAARYVGPGSGASAQ